MATPCTSSLLIQKQQRGPRLLSGVIRRWGMGNDLQEPSVEVGRILFRSWEHQWETGENEAPWGALSKRTMTSDVTQPIYEILTQWEQDLLRSSLPFSPYGLRIRPANNDWMTFADGDYHLVEA